VVAAQVLLWWLVMMDDPIRATYPRFSKMLSDVYSHPTALKVFKVHACACVRKVVACEHTVCPCYMGTHSWKPACVASHCDKNKCYL